MLKLANEFKDLNEAAKDGYNRYSAAVTALKGAETMGFDELMKQVKRASKGGEGVMEP